MKALLIVLIWLGLIVFFIGGWIGNLVHLIKYFETLSTPEVVASILGIPFPPVGAIVFWFIF